MVAYREKLLELKSIEKESDKYFLNVRLSFEQNTEMLWLVDEYTAKNIEAVAHFDKKYRYRLSFNSFRDINQNYHTSILTKTYLDQSEPLCFLCSEEYIDNLKAIKCCEHINDLDEQTFSFINLLSNDTNDENTKESNEDNIHKKHNHNPKQRFAFAVSIILFALISYFGCIYISKNSINEKVLAQSIQLDNETEESELFQIVELSNQLNRKDFVQVIEVINNEIVIQEGMPLYLENYSVEEDANPQQSDIPFLELDEIITYSIPEGYVALTFDDGPSEYSVSIMEILKKYGVGGTFFFTGYNVIKYPDYVQYIHSNGYSIGSHSISHANMSTLSHENQEKELVQSINFLNEITKGEIKLFRPPYGSYNENLKSLLIENQYKMVLWNNDPEDWKTRNEDKIYNNIKNTNVSGSIILLHESQAVIDALPSIIEYLKELGLKIVSLK